jgi:hypothetical protein
MGGMGVWRVTEATGQRDNRQPLGVLHAVQWAGHDPECGLSIHGMYLFVELDVTTGWCQ